MRTLPATRCTAIRQLQAHKWFESMFHRVYTVDNDVLVGEFYLSTPLPGNPWPHECQCAAFRVYALDHPDPVIAGFTAQMLVHLKELVKDYEVLRLFATASPSMIDALLEAGFRGFDNEFRFINPNARFKKEKTNHGKIADGSGFLPGLIT